MSAPLSRLCHPYSRFESYLKVGATDYYLYLLGANATP